MYGGKGIGLCREVHFLYCLPINFLLWNAPLIQQYAKEQGFTV